jgi:hypothetical protein
MGLNYELRTFEKLINEILQAGNLTEVISNTANIPEWRKTIFSEKERILNQFAQTVYNSKENQRIIYIRHHQKSIIRLADKVYQYLLPKEPEDIYKLSPETDLSNFCKEVFQCLEGLLQFIEENFKEYFNLDEKVTDVYLQITQQVLGKQLKLLRHQLKKGKVDKRLQKIALWPITSFCKKEKVSYRQLLYIKQLVRGLVYLTPNPSPKGEGKISRKIVGLLIYLNYNTGEFVSFCLAKIVDTINALTNQKERIAKLIECRKFFRQMRVRPGIGFRLLAETAKEQICGWINEEIHYLEEKHPLLSVAPLIKDDDIIRDEEKLHFSVSVHVLGILARAAHDSKLILNKEGTTVFENISKYCSTIKTKSPSAGSMDRKSHEAERSQKEKAILVLQEMIGRIMEY